MKNIFSAVGLRFCLLFLALHIFCCQCHGQSVVFYGGDFDGRDGASSQWTPAYDAMIYDDFSITQTTEISAIWGNFGMNYIPTQIYFEIRAGVSAGNGGTLLDSGIIPDAVTPTGRDQIGLPEYQVLADVSMSLPAGTYWLGIAPVGGFYDTPYLSTASGTSDNTPGDPNPVPTGSPLANGNSFFSGPEGDFKPTANTTLGSGVWDFSYGVEAVP